MPGDKGLPGSGRPSGEVDGNGVKILAGRGLTFSDFHIYAFGTGGSGFIVEFSICNLGNIYIHYQYYHYIDSMKAICFIVRS